MTETIAELRKPLTEIEKGELLNACRHAGLTEAGLLLLRRLMFQVNDLLAAAEELERLKGLLVDVFSGCKHDEELTPDEINYEAHKRLLAEARRLATEKPQ